MENKKIFYNIEIFIKKPEPYGSGLKKD